MGVAGSGKSAIARRLADRLHARFVEADDAHPPANVDKMAAGAALTDADRAPWLERLRDELGGTPPVVITCSALKRRYRDVLREAGGVRFVLLDIDPGTAADRVATRAGHFMPASLVASQFGDLELPDDEPDVTIVDATRPVDDVVASAFESLTSR